MSPVGSSAARPRRVPRPEPLWRDALGRRLRALRALQRQTLAETANRAGISPQYLSEIERGLKEPSSEMIAAITGALEIALVDLTAQVSEDLRMSYQRDIRFIDLTADAGEPAAAGSIGRRVDDASLLQVLMLAA